SNLGLTDVQKGMIHMSWNSNQGIATSSAPLFYIVVRSKIGAVNASELFNLSSEFLATEAYTQELDVLNIQLRERTSHQSLAKFELYQNTPNPFSEKTNIAFQSPASERVFLKIHDISGKLLLIKQIDAHSGLNVIALDKNDFASGNGVFYYTLETSSLVSTKKMILSK
ncbi:MAG TPA: T9SS type A sorting domain-containing protein, partial [Saprospiraceae bacterium]|nr:T9SS type A sorting domain-containing protein [Saprospiraceae bacterium]